MATGGDQTSEVAAFLAIIASEPADLRQGTTCLLYCNRRLLAGDTVHAAIAHGRISEK